MSYEKNSEKLLAVRYYAKQVKMSMIVVYAPTEDADGGEKDPLYEQLQNINDKVPKHDASVIVGDLNATVRKDNNNWQKIMRPHGTGTRNSNGQWTARVLCRTQPRDRRDNLSA